MVVFPTPGIPQVTQTVVLPLLGSWSTMGVVKVRAPKQKAPRMVVITSSRLVKIFILKKFDLNFPRRGVQNQFLCRFLCKILHQDPKFGLLEKIKAQAKKCENGSLVGVILVKIKILCFNKDFIYEIFKVIHCFESILIDTSTPPPDLSISP